MSLIIWALKAQDHSLEGLSGFIFCDIAWKIEKLAFIDIIKFRTFDQDIMF